MISYNKTNKTFKLDTKNTTYQFMIAYDEFLVHLYYGNRLNSDAITYLNDEEIRSGCCYKKEIGNHFSLDSAMLEYSYFGTGDYSVESLKILNKFGDCNTHFKYKDYEIFKGRKGIPSMPYGKNTEDCSTLKIMLTDEETNIDLEMYYVVYENLDVIARYNRLINTSKSSVLLEKFSSQTLDFPPSNYNVISLDGRYALERDISRENLSKGVRVLESARGVSSHQTNPFVALLDENTTNDFGDVYGFLLAYSGDFKIEIERNQYDNARVNTLINDRTTKFFIDSNEDIYTPETILTYTNLGLNKMTQNFHKFIKETYLNNNFLNKKRPVKVNTWEGNYFDINEEKLLKYAKNAKEIGADLLVVDDGWYHKRNNDTAGLGDWFYDKSKFPNGLSKIADCIREAGLDFGIWLEPEMISENSDLYREHPDWVLSNNSRKLSLSRNQLVLDLTNPEIVDYIYNAISNVIKETKASYLKLDMNRPLCEVGSSFLPKERQMEVSYRYMLGVYEVYRRLNQSYPDILIESCSSGGGRFDLGMLKYSTQVWTSDNTSPYERLAIQKGTSLVYPLCTISNHLTTGLNGGSMRNTSLEYRHGIANLGVLGYELDLNILKSNEITDIKDMLNKYRNIQDTIIYGETYLISDLLDQNLYSMNIISKDKQTVYLYVSQSRGDCNRKNLTVKLKGLEKDSIYIEESENLEYTGQVLMSAGYMLNNFNGDDKVREVIFKKIS